MVVQFLLTWPLKTTSFKGADGSETSVPLGYILILIQNKYMVTNVIPCGPWAWMRC